MGIYSLKNVYDVLKDTTFFTDHKPYIFRKFDKNNFSELHLEISKYPTVYSEIINDKDELTVIMPKDLWDNEFSKIFIPQESLPDIALITCEIQEQSQGGFLHSLITMLSTHNI